MERDNLAEMVATPAVLTKLNEATGLDIELELREGGGYADFNGDLRGIEKVGGRKVAIMVQSGESDNKHLLRLLHNAADKDAQVLIWIVERVNRMHPSTMDWLKSNTVESVSVHFLALQKDPEVAFLPISVKNWRKINK